MLPKGQACKNNPDTHPELEELKAMSQTLLGKQAKYEL